MAESTLIDPVLERLLAGGPLSPDERRRLADAPDILALGMAADELRSRKVGRTTTFCRVAEFELRGLAESVTLPAGAGEARLIGALDDLPAAVVAVERVAAAAAGRVPLSGFSLADVERAASGDPQRARSVLRALRAAGLELLADVPVDAVESLEPLIEGAREEGLTISRLTVNRPPPDRAALLERLSAIVSGDPAITTVNPLPRLVPVSTPTTGYDDVRLVALTRLLVPVAHVQVDWARYGPKLAQVALTFGANDLDAVSPLDDTGEGRRRAPLAEVVRNIQAAGGEPVERDGRFTPRGR